LSATWRTWRFAANTSTSMQAVMDFGGDLLYQRELLGIELLVAFFEGVFALATTIGLYIYKLINR
jgi:hypothetical protein